MTKIPLIYIVGSGHCGSTLLDLILDSHSKIAGIGELYQWPDIIKQDKESICTCGQKISDCSFWQKVFKNISAERNLKIYRSKKDFLLNKNNFFEFGEKENKKKRTVNKEKFLRKQEEIYKNILRENGKQVLVDSSKDPDRLELLLKSKKLEILIIHLVRDGRAVVWSYKKKYTGVEKPINVYGRWFLKNIKTELVKRRNKVTSIFIKYEDFCQKPEKYLKIILDNVGLFFEEEMLDFRKKEHHQIGGNRLRFAKDKEIKVDLIWKKEMPLFYRLTFNLFFGWLNVIYKIKKSK